MRLAEIYNGEHRSAEVSTPAFQKEFDVIVCGLGTAGALAALFCAQNGLRVLGIEPFTCVGGTHTAGGVGSHYFGCPGGRYEQLDTEVEDYFKRFTATKTESRKLVTEAELLRYGVEILYEATPCGVYLEERTVVGVQVFTNHGMENYRGKILMDCTAEAHIAAMAECATQMGRETDGQMQPYSIVSLLKKDDRYGFNNVDFGRVNQLDSEALAKAILFARSYEMGENRKGQLIVQMPLVGIREGRRIVAEEGVQLSDLFGDRCTAEPMYYAYADLDKHGWDIAFDGETIGDWAIGANIGAYNVTVPVPYKAILPAGFDGILVPCRALGVDRDISSCVRMNPDMKKLAECAAEWATLSIEQDVTLREVPYAQLKERLCASGCLKERDNRGVRIDGAKNWDKSVLVPEDVHWITEPGALAERLGSDKPGIAIWSAKRMGQEAAEILGECLASQEEHLRKHAAFALGILGNPEGIPVLREMAVTRDGFMLKDCRKHNNLRGCMAIYWLGRLGDREIVPELVRLICDEKECDHATYHQTNVQTTRYKVNDFQDVYFQFLSQAVMALVRIGDRHPDLRTQIGDGFVGAFADGSYYSRITQRPVESSEGNMVCALKQVAYSAMEKWEKGL